MKKFLCQNAHYETKSFPELVTKYLIKFEKEIMNILQVQVKMDSHILQ